jgi:RNA polymerase sigma factor (sigma-70 family)
MNQLSYKSLDRYQSLLDRLGAGDTRARRELLDVSAHRLRTIAQAQLRGFRPMQRWVQSDDVLQEGLVRIYKSFEHDVRPITVLDYFRFSASQMRRGLIDLWRHYYGPEGIARHHATPRPDQGSSGQSWDPLDRPDKQPDASRVVELAELHETIERLPDPLRTAFDLLWYQELTYAESAQLLGTSVRQIGRIWREAKIALRERLPR